jgi:hypothetical protein
LVLFLLLVVTNFSFGQRNNLTQNIRGTVIDELTQSPLTGANVAVMDSTAQMGAVTNDKGEFVIENVPVGRQSLQVSYIGYHPVILNNIIVTSARQVVLNINMVQKVETTEEVVVVGSTDNRKYVDRMATVSTRVFSLKEATRYAGSREDIARMAMNFAGVSGANDQRNDIIIRGNSPNGILWRLDDVDIPNPNHFAATGTTGGPISILNNNVLRNSDFYTGAFPAQFSNVFSGVFDLEMREGNNQKTEVMGQIGFNGAEIGLEGPLFGKGKSSYLVHGRYSFLGLFDKIGFDFGTSGVPKYKDLTYKFNFPVENGKITLFGLGGGSQIGILDSREDNPDLYSLDGMDVYNGSNLWVTGLSYTNLKNENAYSKTILSYVYQNPFTVYNMLDEDNKVVPRYAEENTEMKLTLKFLYNQKYSKKLTARYGAAFDLWGFNLNTSEYVRADDSWRYLLDENKTVGNGTNLSRVFSQFSYKFNDNLELKPGLNLIYFGLNESFNVEPRIGFTWRATPTLNLNIGAGAHSRVLSMATYYYKSIGESGMPELANMDLDLLKANHYVIGFDWLIAENLLLKSEIYYQYLYDIPVEERSSSYSYINEGANWGLNTRDKLVSKGTGENYGIELTFEKYFDKSYYFLFTSSLFDAKYCASDGVFRNTAFNGNFVFNLLFGKEFKLSENTVTYFDLKSTLAGGRRYTPINVDASREKGGALETVYMHDRAFEEQFPNYFKTDVKLGFRFNRKRFSQVMEFSVENVTNHFNPYFHSYNKMRDEIVMTPQMGILPLAKYRVYF